MSIGYNQVAREYARHRRVHPGVFRRLIQDGGCGPDSRVLEVGAGTGNYITAIQALTGCVGWGADPSEQMRAQARARGSKVDFHLGRAESLEFDDVSFDLVFSVDVIHHVQGHLAYFQEAHRVLRPGGGQPTRSGSFATGCPSPPTSRRPSRRNWPGIPASPASPG